MLDNNELARRIAFAFSTAPRGTKAAVARECGINPQAITGWESNGAIDKFFIPALARHTKRRPEYFLDEAISDAESAVSTAGGADHADVIGFAQAAGLGAGAEAEEYAETHSLKFKKTSLRRRGLQSQNLAVYYGRGDSMEPTIKDGDAILFDTSDTRVLDGVLYVIQVDGMANPEFFVKRAMVLDTGVYFQSDNPRGDHQWQKPKPMASKRNPITVIGRVHWIGGWAD
ncbi:S24 family peptidase [Stenotrophomonas maltophilia]|uniref:S24 family peptidase n=1 Tax=Stenotrophomonas maltophilia TaxID=40324 RepID=UPI0039F6BFF7